MIHYTYWGVTGYNFKIYCISLNINFVLAYSADPDEMLHKAAFHLGLYCLSKYQLRGSGLQMVKSMTRDGRVVAFLFGEE